MVTLPGKQGLTMSEPTESGPLKGFLHLLLSHSGIFFSWNVLKHHHQFHSLAKAAVIQALGRLLP